MTSGRRATFDPSAARADHARRVDDVCATRTGPDLLGHGRVPGTDRNPSGYPVHAVALGPRRTVRSGHDRHLVAAREQLLGELRGMARGAADVRRPDARDDQHPHAAAPLICASSTTQIRQKTTVEASTAPAAPGRSPLAAEDDDERDHHDRLDAVREDAQPRPADRDRQRLRPAEDELERRREQHEPRRVARSLVVLAVEDAHEPGHEDVDRRHDAPPSAAPPTTRTAGRRRTPRPSRRVPSRASAR